MENSIISIKEKVRQGPYNLVTSTTSFFCCTCTKPWKRAIMYFFVLGVSISPLFLYFFYWILDRCSDWYFGSLFWLVFWIAVLTGILDCCSDWYFGLLFWLVFWITVLTGILDRCSDWYFGLLFWLVFWIAVLTGILDRCSDWYFGSLFWLCYFLLFHFLTNSNNIVQLSYRSRKVWSIGFY